MPDKPKAITTATTKPATAPYIDPRDRKPAKGPMITTANIAEIRAANRAEAKKGKGKKD